MVPDRGQRSTVLRRVRANAGSRLYALTNWSAETFPLRRSEQYDFLGWFEEIVRAFTGDGGQDQA